MFFFQVYAPMQNVIVLGAFSVFDTAAAIDQKKARCRSPVWWGQGLMATVAEFKIWCSDMGDGLALGIGCVIYIYIYINVYIYIYIHIYIYICIHVCVLVYMYHSMYAYMHICMCVCVLSLCLYPCWGGNDGIPLELGYPIFRQNHLGSSLLLVAVALHESKSW